MAFIYVYQKQKTSQENTDLSTTLFGAIKLLFKTLSFDTGNRSFVDDFGRKFVINNSFGVA